MGWMGFLGLTIVGIGSRIATTRQLRKESSEP